MATYVLIHGAWHGGWCWNKVIPMNTSHSPFFSAPEALAGHLVSLGS